MSLKKIAVLLFDDAELLDFTGPLEVFGALKYLFPEECEKITTIGLSDPITISKLDMKIIPGIQKKIDDDYDLLVIPGGMGTRSIIKNEDNLMDIQGMIQRSYRIASVCTGSLILAKLGLLKDRIATTHFAATDLLKELDPSIEVDRSKRYHDHDSVIIAEGVSAGIDMSFHLISKFCSKDISDKVRQYIEYHQEKT